MCSSPRYLRDDAARRCAICDGKFGLIRYYSWRTALCSRKCADRFKARREADRRWLRRFQADNGCSESHWVAARVACCDRQVATDGFARAL
jgi:hypothetical protein